MSESLNVSQTLQENIGPYAEFLYLMGSAETPRFHAESDIDIIFARQVLETGRLLNLRNRKKMVMSAF